MKRQSPIFLILLAVCAIHMAITIALGHIWLLALGVPTSALAAWFYWKSRSEESLWVEADNSQGVLAYWGGGYHGVKAILMNDGNLYYREVIYWHIWNQDHKYVGWDAAYGGPVAALENAARVCSAGHLSHLKETGPYSLRAYEELRP